MSTGAYSFALGPPSRLGCVCRGAFYIVEICWCPSCLDWHEIWLESGFDSLGPLMLIPNDIPVAPPSGQNSKFLHSFHQDKVNCSKGERIVK